MSDVGELFEAILAAPAIGGIRLVTVDGPAGSGKSTLARALADEAAARDLGEVPVIPIDDFVGWTDLDPDGERWWRRLEVEVLSQLFAGRAPEWHRRDWHRFPDGLGVSPATVTAKWHPIAILEGVTAGRLAAADRAAFKVWVEAPAAERLRRGIARDGETEREHWRRWQELEAAFYAADDVRGRAMAIVETGTGETGGSETGA